MHTTSDEVISRRGANSTGEPLNVPIVQLCVVTDYAATSDLRTQIGGSALDIKDLGAFGNRRPRLTQEASSTVRGGMTFKFLGYLQMLAAGAARLVMAFPPVWLETRYRPGLRGCLGSGTGGLVLPVSGSPPVAACL